MRARWVCLSWRERSLAIASSRAALLTSRSTQTGSAMAQTRTSHRMRESSVRVTALDMLRQSRSVASDHT